jgi:hypothetical protein
MNEKTNIAHVLATLSGTQTQLAYAVKLLLECRPLLKLNKIEYADTLASIEKFIKDYTCITTTPVSRYE